MNKLFLMLSAVSSLALAGCGTTSGMPPADHVSNGEYFLVKYPGNLPHVEDAAPAATYGIEEFDQLAYLDRDCRQQMASQVPSTLKSVATTTLRTAIPMAIGGGIGTGQGISHVTSAVKGYAAYGAWSAGGSGAGGGIGGGIDRHLTGNRYAIAGCMNANVAEAKKQDGALKGINPVFNADAVNGKSWTRPSGPVSTQTVKRKPDASAEPAAAPPR